MSSVLFTVYKLRKKIKMLVKIRRPTRIKKQSPKAMKTYLKRQKSLERRKSSMKKLLREISKNSQGRICVEVSFLKLDGLDLELH